MRPTSAQPQAGKWSRRRGPKIVTDACPGRCWSSGSAIRTDGATVAATLLLDAQPRKAASVRVNHAGSWSQGKCPAPGHLHTVYATRRPHTRHRPAAEAREITDKTHL